MFQKITAKLAVFCLKHSRLSGEQKAFVTTALLDNLSAIPLRDIIRFDDYGVVLINGKKLEVEQALAFKESCKTMKDSFARKVIQEQVAYEAIKMGIHQGLTPDMIMFSKAALWYAQEENKLLSTVTTE